MADHPEGQDEPMRLVEGNQLRCPHCKELGDVLVNFKPLERPEQFSNELNVVQRHRKEKGGCGHVFSPGDPWIMAEYLAGNLIPKSHLDEAMKIIIELRVQLNEYKQIAEERRVKAA